MQIGKGLKNDCLHVSKAFWIFYIPITSYFAVTYPWNLLFSIKVAYVPPVSIVFSVYKQKFTTQ